MHRARQRAVALILGGSSGIGLATAHALGARGARVHIVGRDEARLAKAVATAPNLIGHRADAGDREQLGRVFDLVARCDWLVLSMSSGGGAGAFADLEAEILRQALAAKTLTYVSATQTALPYMSERGSITFVTAISARAPIQGTAGLAAVNGAIEAMIQPLAVELAPMRINAVSPGIVDTNWWRGQDEKTRAEYFGRVAQALPLGRVASAADVGDAVALVAANPNITGTVVESDGGARFARWS